MNREALENLARVVAQADEERWNMRFFGTENTCRCAAGHAQEDAWFREQRISFQNAHGGLNWDALREPFGLTKREVRDLFGAEVLIDQTVSKLAVLAQIKRILEGKPTKEY